MYKYKKLLIFVSIFFLLISLYSCKDDIFYQEHVEIKTDFWNVKDVAFFNTTIQEPDDLYQIFLDIDCKDDFLTNNLWLSVSVKSPSGVVQRDTVMYNITDEKGRWYGDKNGNIIHYRFIYRNSISFPVTGEYIFEISHLMRESDKPSVSSVGIVINKVEKLVN